MQASRFKPRSRNHTWRGALLLPLLSLPLLLLSGCYSELEDEELYEQLKVNDETRIPNQPLGASAAPPATSGAAPTTTAPGASTAPTTSTAPTGSTAPTSSSPEPSMPLSAECSDIVERVLNAEFGCGTAACHGSGSLLIDLGTVEGAHERLVDKTAVYCPDLKYVDTSDPSNSAILEKLKQTPSCGSRMPPTGDPLPAAEIACITEWVNALARGDL